MVVLISYDFNIIITIYELFVPTGQNECVQDEDNFGDSKQVQSHASLPLFSYMKHEGGIKERSIVDHYHSIKNNRIIIAALDRLKHTEKERLQINKFATFQSLKHGFHKILAQTTEDIGTDTS